MLTWFRDRGLTFDANGIANNDFDDSQDDLDLELWTVHNGAAGTLVAQFNNAFNVVEHFSITIPETAESLRRVRWFSEILDVVGDANQETFGLAWLSTLVPEPGSEALCLIDPLGVGLAIAGRRRCDAAGAGSPRGCAGRVRERPPASEPGRRRVTRRGSARLGWGGGRRTSPDPIHPTTANRS